MIYLWWTLWFKRMHMSDKYKWIWARKMHLNSIAQPNEINFKWIATKKKGKIKQTNTDLLCVWRVWNDGGVSLNVLHGNWRKKNIWIGFFYYYFVAVSPRPCHCHQVVSIPFLVRLVSWNEYIVYYTEIHLVATHHFTFNYGCVATVRTNRFIHTFNVEDQTNHAFNRSLQNTINARKKQKKKKKKNIHKTMVPMEYCWCWNPVLLIESDLRSFFLAQAKFRYKLKLFGIFTRFVLNGRKMPENISIEIIIPFHRTNTK